MPRKAAAGPRMVIEKARRKGPVRQTGGASAVLAGTTYQNQEQFEESFKKQSGFLTAEDAAQMATLKDAPYKDALQHLIRKVEQAIRLASYAPGRQSNIDTLYEVPAMIPDKMPYALNTVMPDLVSHFRDCGFHSEFMEPNFLYVNWKDSLDRRKAKTKTFRAPSSKRVWKGA